MNEYPTLLYRVPGTHQCPGGTFDYRPARDEEEALCLLDDGWHETLARAIGVANETNIPAEAPASSPIASESPSAPSFEPAKKLRRRRQGTP